MALIPLSEHREVTGELFWLDEKIVERLSRRNTKQGLSEGTKETYKSALRDFNQFLIKNELPLGEGSLLMYFDFLRGRLRASTLNLRKYALLKCIKAQVGGDSITRAMIIDYVFEQIPTYQTEKAVPRDKCPTEEQVIQLVSVAPTQKTALIIHFLFKSACRVSEALNIRLTDCQRVGENLRIQIFGKGNKARHIEIPFALYEAIRHEYQGKKYLFESKSGHPLLRQNVEKQVKRAGRKIGLKISPHAMRHARATDIHINKGISLTATSRLLGHADPSITAKMYVHDTVNYAELFARDRI
jgi:integrase/recombinase XerD